RYHRRVERVGDAEFAEQQRPDAAETIPARNPDLDDALDVLLRLWIESLAGIAAAEVHRHGAAHALEAGMHLGADRPRRASCERICRPELLFREKLGERL